jgi:hypothetical protein
MAYFAQIDETGTVVQVIAVSNDDAPDPAPAHSEPIGQAFIANVLGLPGEWRQTSYNNSFRKQYAGIGWRYDANGDVFIAPQPYPSWSLDANYDWHPPTPMPETEGEWSWDEDAQAWVDLTPAE